jgi:hypothetical protein
LDVEGTAGDESDTALGVRGLVSAEEVELVVFKLVVANVTVAVEVELEVAGKPNSPLACKEEDIVALGEEGDDDTAGELACAYYVVANARAGVKALGVEVLEASGLPERELTVRHAAELRGVSDSCCRFPLTPVVAIRSRSPSHTTRDPLIPP